MIYVIVVTHGEYGDRTEWLERAFVAESMADTFRKEAQRWIDGEREAYTDALLECEDDDVPDYERWAYDDEDKSPTRYEHCSEHWVYGRAPVTGGDVTYDVKPVRIGRSMQTGCKVDLPIQHVGTP